MPLEAIRYQDADREPWDRFVFEHPDGTPFHLIAWREAIVRTFGYRPMYLLARGDGGVEGVLPLFLVKNLVLGKALISSPFAVYGGALTVTEQAKAVLSEELRRLAVSFGTDYAELRNWRASQRLGFTPLDRYVTFECAIAPEQESLLEAIPRKTRYMVRKALKLPFSTRRRTGRSEDFERLYTENLRRLGTPCFPSRHFRNLAEAFGEALDIREVVYENRVVAAVLSLHFRDRVLPYYGASDPRYNAAAPNNYMYFDLIRSAARDGERVFDFGRSRKGSGSYDFKSRWGMEERALPYEALLNRRATLPNYGPANPRIQVFTRLWRRIPLPITRVLGPALVRLAP